MSDSQTLNYSIDERVATICLNKPDTLNAISQLMRHELLETINKLEAMSEVRVVILKAEGKGFSSGTDLSEGLAGFETIHDQIQEEYRPIFMAIANSEKVYMSSVHGACAGIGAGLAMVCDLCVMADNAFLYLAFASLSLVTDGGMSHHLVNAMGYKKAYQTFIECKRITASECLEYDLVNKVVAFEKLEEESLSWATTLANGAPISQKIGKQIMRNVHKVSFEDTFDQESINQTKCMESKDFQGAIQAFFAKKTPVFKGE
jgi:2-(1,2-epoxy-1,2-dihydrophenyl)acetyl-CoA isomerase